MTLKASGKDLLRKGRALASSLLSNGAPEPREDVALRDALALLTKRRLCPICLAEFVEFGRYNRRRRARCPECGSLERHRMAWLYLKHETQLFFKPTRLLHFAPEPFFAERIDSYFNIDHVKASYDPAKPDEGIDIQRLPFEDGSFDMIFCSHVLEHVPDDRLAMREMRRVLRDDGVAVLLVPMRNEPATYEDPTITTPEARAEAFGQWDHLRWYGRDFSERLSEAGFAADMLYYADGFSPEEQVRYGIRPPGHPLFTCRKR